MGRLDGHLDYRPLASVRIEQATRDGISVGIAEHMSVTREERAACPRNIADVPQSVNTKVCMGESLCVKAACVSLRGSCFIFCALVCIHSEGSCCGSRTYEAHVSTPSTLLPRLSSCAFRATSVDEARRSSWPPSLRARTLRRRSPCRALLLTSFWMRHLS